MVMAGLLAGSGLVQAGPVHDFGGLASSGPDLHGRARSRALGPLLEWADTGDRPALRAVRPFFTFEDDAGTGRAYIDVLWPVGHLRQWEGRTDWRFLTAFYFGAGPDDLPSQYRFWLLPVMALGRNQKGEDYGAIFPLGGRVDNWFGRDRVEFALFPLWWHSELNDLRTDHWLWPIVSRTTGDDTSRFRIFPLYGRSARKGEGESRFILWPFWTQTRFDRPGGRGKGYMLFPLYGHSKRENGESWMVLPPLFRHSVGKTGTENVYLWPFIQTRAAKDDSKVYVWPLYGRRTTSDENRRFWLWPFIWARHETRFGLETDHVRLFPLVAAESSRPASAPTNVVDRYVSVWPLLSYERTPQDNRRVRVPDLWPFRNTAPVERNLSPLWTAYQYERTARGRESELLWGMARWGSETNGTAYGSLFPLASWAHDREADTHREWDFLKGLLGYQRNEAGKQWRMLYFIRWRTRP